MWGNANIKLKPGGLWHMVYRVRVHVQYERPIGALRPIGFDIGATSS